MLVSRGRTNGRREWKLLEIANAPVSSCWLTTAADETSVLNVMCEVKPGKNLQTQMEKDQVKTLRERNDEAFVVQTIKTFSEGSKNIAAN